MLGTGADLLQSRGPVSAINVGCDRLGLSGHPRTGRALQFG
jgi:hypothetical protein